MRPYRRRLADEDFRTWGCVFVLACCLATAAFCVLNSSLGDMGETLTGVPTRILQWGTGFAFCAMPLIIAGLPIILIMVFFRPQTQARRRAQRGDLQGALQAYQRQLETLNRYPWLEAIRGYIFGEQRQGLREGILLSMARIAYEQNEFQQATNYLWRCLHHNPHNREAQVLLDVIRNLPHDGIRGW